MKQDKQVTLRNIEPTGNYGSSIYLVHSNGSYARMNVAGDGSCEVYANSTSSYVKLNPGGSSWTSASSRLLKTPVNINVDHTTNIELLHSMPIDRWYYNADESKREYLGPYAEDIHEKFHLSDGNGISTLDNDGVLYSCLKGMYVKHLELQETVQEQQEIINRLLQTYPL